MASTTVKWDNATTNSSYASDGVAALNSWGNSATPIGFQAVSSGANLRIANGNFGSTGFDGITRDTAGSSPPACQSTGTWSTTVVVWWNGYHADGYSSAKRRSVMAHEVGHALGLAHTRAATCANVTLLQPDTSTRYDACRIVAPNA